MHALRVLAGVGFAIVALGLASSPARAAQWLDGRIELHGALEAQFRSINHDFRHEWDLSQWRNSLELELEVRLLEEPPAFFPWLDDASLFVRTEVSYDCVWRRGCGMFPSVDAYGNRANGIPSKYRDGKRNGFVGDDPALNVTFLHGSVAAVTRRSARAPFDPPSTLRRQPTTRGADRHLREGPHSGALLRGASDRDPYGRVLACDCVNPSGAVAP